MCDITARDKGSNAHRICFIIIPQWAKEKPIINIFYWPLILYQFQYTLTGHFIRYTLLVPGWTRFCLQNCLNSSWHRFNKVFLDSSEILVHIAMIASRSCCRFVGCTSMMQIFRSTTSQRCSIGLRSGDCGGNLSKVNSLSCSKNQSEMIWALWHGALSCWKYSSEDGYTVS